MTLLIGERYRPLLAQSLAAQGLAVFWLPDNAAVDPRLAGHADLSVFVSGRRAVVAEGVYPYIVNFLTNRGYTVSRSNRQGPVYPADAGLCVRRTGKYTIYDPETVDPAVQDMLDGVPVAVRQGYARCAAAAVDDHSIITADAGVSRAAKNAGMDVLDIAAGHIALDGYDAGFIGGALFLLNSNMYFTGVLDRHPDRDRIIRFVAEHGKKPVFLTDRPIFDIGGAIPV